MMIIWKQIHFKERDLAAMTEEEQIAYAMQMSMAENEGGEGGSEEKMDVDDKEQDYSEVGHT